MADIERVKQGLRCCQYASKSQCDDCKYCYDGLVEILDCTADLASDALSVIEDLQAEIERLQPKKSKWIFTGQKNAYGGTVIQCPFCDDKYAAQNPSDEHFCRNCGAKLMD